MQRPLADRFATFRNGSLLLLASAAKGRAAVGRRARPTFEAARETAREVAAMCVQALYNLTCVAENYEGLDSVVKLIVQLPTGAGAAAAPDTRKLEVVVHACCNCSNHFKLRMRMLEAGAVQTLAAVIKDLDDARLKLDAATCLHNISSARACRRSSACAAPSASRSRSTSAWSAARSAADPICSRWSASSAMRAVVSSSSRSARCARAAACCTCRACATACCDHSCVHLRVAVRSWRPRR